MQQQFQWKEICLPRKLDRELTNTLFIHSINSTTLLRSPHPRQVLKVPKRLNWLSSLFAVGLNNCNNAWEWWFILKTWWCQGHFPINTCFGSPLQLPQGSSTGGDNGGELRSSSLSMPCNKSPSHREDVHPDESEDVHDGQHGGDVGGVGTECPPALKRSKKAADAVSGGDESGLSPSIYDANDSSEGGEKQGIESVHKKVRRSKPSRDHEAVVDVNKYWQIRTLVEDAQKDWTRMDIAECTQESDGCLGMWTCPLLDIVNRKMDTSSLLFLAW